MNRVRTPGLAVRVLRAALAALLLAGCGGRGAPRPTLTWTPAELPAPAGSRAMPRDATWCAGRWVVVGATADAAGLTRPAVWSSTDARTWRPMTLHPGRDYYAERAILGSVGCHGNRLAVLGAMAGGAHGMPRTATWRQRPDGSLTVVRAPYLLYGGTQSVDVSRIVGGPDGFLIAGTRTSGAAVWTSRTGATFRLHAGVPGLANTQVTRTQATDAACDGRRWVVAGTSTDILGRLYATVWTPVAPERWRRETLPGGRSVTTADRELSLGSAVGPVVAGVLDERFGLWLRSGGSWSLETAFGERDPDGTDAPYVAGLVLVGAQVLASYSDGAHFRLALGGGRGLTDLPLPTTVTVTGDHTATLAAQVDQALLLTDDGQRGRVWLAHVPGSSG